MNNRQSSRQFFVALLRMPVSERSSRVESQTVNRGALGLIASVMIAIFSSTPMYSHADNSCAGYPIHKGYCQVPLATVLANPERFDGTKVSVVGYYQSRMEMSGLFLVKDYADLAILSGAVWVNRSPYRFVLEQMESGGDESAELIDDLANKGMLIDHTAWHNGYVHVLGGFRAGRAGHLGAYDGELQNAVLVEIAPPPPEEIRLLPR